MQLSDCVQCKSRLGATTPTSDALHRACHDTTLQTLQHNYQHHPSTIHNFSSNEQGSLLPRTMRHSKATQSSQHDRKQGLSYQIIRQANQGATQKWLNPHDMWQETGLILSNYQVGKSDPTLQQDRKRETYQMIRLANQGESVQRLLNYVNVSSGFPSFQHRDSSVQDCATFT